MVLWLPCAFFVLFLDPVDKVFFEIWCRLYAAAREDTQRYGGHQLIYISLWCNTHQDRIVRVEFVLYATDL
jgi:hypothetical protein